MSSQQQGIACGFMKFEALHAHASLSAKWIVDSGYIGDGIAFPVCNTSNVIVENVVVNDV